LPPEGLRHGFDSRYPLARISSIKPRVFFDGQAEV